MNSNELPVFLKVLNNQVQSNLSSTCSEYDSEKELSDLSVSEAGPSNVGALQPQTVNIEHLLRSSFPIYYDETELPADENARKSRAGSSSLSSTADQESVRKLLNHSICNNYDEDFVTSMLHKPPAREKISRRQWTSSEYKAAKSELYSGISFEYRTGVIVWCPRMYCKTDLVQKLLQKYGETVIIHDRWIRDKNESVEDVWGGVLAVFLSEIQAKRAAKEIPEQYNIFKAMKLSTLLRCFVRTELDLCAEQGTGIFVSVPSTAGAPVIVGQELERLFHRFGRLEPGNEDCYQVVGRTAVQYKVTYAHAAHAFLAAEVLDGLPYGSGAMKVRVQETKKERRILRDLVFELQKHSGSSTPLVSGMI